MSIYLINLKAEFFSFSIDFVLPAHQIFYQFESLAPWKNPVSAPDPSNFIRIQSLIETFHEFFKASQ